MFNFTLLYDEIRKDDYAGKSDVEIAEILNQPQFPAICERFVNERTIIAIFEDPAEGEAVLQALELAAEVNPLVKRALKWMAPSEQGIDVGMSGTRTMLDSLVSGGVLTQSQGDKLKALGEKQISWAEKNLGQAVHHLDIARAFGRGE